MVTTISGPAIAIEARLWVEQLEGLSSGGMLYAEKEGSDGKEFCPVAKILLLQLRQYVWKERSCNPEGDFGAFLEQTRALLMEMETQPS